MLKVFHSELSLQQLNKRYVASLRLHIWSDGKAIVVDYVFGSYDAETATLKQVAEDARNQYIKTLNEFAEHNDTGPLFSFDELTAVVQTLNLRRNERTNSPQERDGYSNAVSLLTGIINELSMRKTQS